MREKMRGKIHRTFLTVFAFVLAVVFAGFVGRIDVKADTAICKVTVKVKDTGGNEIENAVVHFVTKKSSVPGGDGEVVAETSKNDDGTYNVPYEAEYGDYYWYYATAEGYKTPTAYSTRVTIENPTATLTDIVLESYSFDQMVQDALSKAENEIRNYVSVDDYDSDGQTEVNDIIDKQVDKLYAIVPENETKESAEEKIASIDKIVQDAKSELDQVVTAQTKMNETYAGRISFVSVNGKTVNIQKDEDTGKYGITLKLNDKGGMFQVSGVEANTVTWNAKKTLWYQSAGRNVEFEYIDNSIVKGKFLNQATSADSSGAIPSDVTIEGGTIENASAKFTVDGTQITVTFDLTFNNEYDETEAVQDVEDKIAALGDEITLENKDAVLAAKAAYEALTEDAKAKVSEGSVNALNKAVATVEKLLDKATIAELREALDKAQKDLEAALTAKSEAETEAAAAEKAKDEAETNAAAAEKAKDEAETKAAAAEKAKDEAETRATKAEEAQKAAETKATDAAAAQKTAETKAANAVTAQKAAETKAANAVTAQKAAETKAVNAEKAQKAAEQKAADAEKKMNAAIKSTLPKLNLKVTAGKKKATLSWNKSTKGTGYIIYRSTSKNGTYVKIKTITNLKTTKFTDKNLKSKQRYYYKICVYQGNVNGTLSTAKNVKVK